MADSKSYAKMVEELKGKTTQEPKVTFGTPQMNKSIEGFSQARASLSAVLQKHKQEIQSLYSKIDSQKKNAESKKIATPPTQALPVVQHAPASGRLTNPDNLAQKKYIVLLEEELAKLKTQNLKLQVDRDTEAVAQSKVDELRRMVTTLKEELVESRAENIALREKILRLQKTDF